MSTQQQAMILETILAIRRTLKRKADESDSDSSIDQSTNRGNKLKKRARYVRQGRLASVGPAAYKEVAEHAGYQRAIISHNPPLIDEDGYDIDSDDDEEQIQEATASAMEDNPYSSIRLEQLLAPLTSVTDLPTHPTLSRPFTSRALNELVEQARNLMHKENAALWKAKPLLTKLVGDNTWAPCGLMTAPDDQDALLFSDTTSFFNRPAPQVPAEASNASNNVDGARPAPGNTPAQQETGPDRPEAQEAVTQPARNADPNTTSADGEVLPDAHEAKDGQGDQGGGPDPGKPSKKEPQVNGSPQQGEDGQGGVPQTENNSGEPNATGGEDVEMAEAPGAVPKAGGEHQGAPIPAAQPTLSGPEPGAAAAAAAAASSPVPDLDDDELFIHPLFRLPRAAHPDRDLGLPEHEAEEVRRLLLLYVQKQEEICRGARRLYEGLLRAERYRRTVWQWAKAEAHCGPNRDMSDGEDWYDKDEWGLTEDLKKGEDEVEEDTGQSQKKTRNRK